MLHMTYAGLGTRYIHCYATPTDGMFRAGAFFSSASYGSGHTKNFLENESINPVVRSGRTVGGKKKKKKKKKGLVPSLWHTIYM